MKIKLMQQSEFDDWALCQEDGYEVFNELDEYVYWKEFSPFLTRDQIRLEIEEYVAQLKGAN